MKKAIVIFCLLGAIPALNAQLPSSWGFIDEKGKEIVPIQAEGGGFSEDYYVGKNEDFVTTIFDSLGNKTVLGEDISTYGHVTEGLLWVENTKLNKFGYVNTKGKTVIPLEYSRVNDFSEGLACVQKFGNQSPVKTEGKFGFLDKNGKTVIDFKYDHAEPFKNGVAVVKQNKKYLLIDKKGNSVLPDSYNGSKGLFGNCYIVQNDADKWALIDRNGKLITPYKYFDLFVGEDDKRFTARENDSAGNTLETYFDENGKEISSNSFDDIGKPVAGCNCFSINKDDKYGLSDNKGKLIVPAKYSEILYSFSDGLMAVKVEKWGFIDINGVEKIPSTYDAVTSFKDGIALVQNNDLWGAIDKTGKVIIPLKYQELDVFVGGLAIAKSGDKYGYIDKNNKVVIPFKYVEATPFVKGMAIVKESEEYYLINIKGDVIRTIEGKMLEAVENSNLIKVVTW